MPSTHDHSVILVVDDERSVRIVTRLMLERLGYTVLDAENGAQALFLCEAFGAPPDLIISDIRMPVVDGSQLVQELERLGGKPRVLLMSGHADEALKVSLGLTPYPFLQKPFGVQELQAKVQETLQG